MTARAAGRARPGPDPADDGAASDLRAYPRAVVPAVATSPGISLGS